ncbi:MAG: hypothetical protein V1754_11075 [Pseudomonadota bacterium]
MSPLLIPNLLALFAFLFGMLILLVLFHLQERVTSRFLAKHLGWKAVLLTGWLGVSAHEFAHLVMAKFFAHRIVAWKLFEPDPVSGTLGYVRHSYSRKSAWQVLGNFFIGMAPVFFGGLLLYGLFWWILPTEKLGLLLQNTLFLGQGTQKKQALTFLVVFEGLRAFGTNLGAALWSSRSLWLPLQIYLGICISSHLAPSSTDFKGAFPGLLVMVVLLAGGAAFCAQLDISLVGITSFLCPMLCLFLATVVFQVSYMMLVATLVRRT